MIHIRIKHWPLLLGTMVLMFDVLPAAQAAYPVLTFRHGHLLYELNPNRYPQWRSEQEQWAYNGAPVMPQAAWRVDGDELPELPEGVERTTVLDWDDAAIERTLEDVIGTKFNRSPGQVVISRDEEDNIVFEGVGMLGRTIDTPAAVALIKEAIEQDINDIHLPVIETQPSMDVQDATLTKSGIKEVVMVGESHFGGSPNNRRNNIAVGLEKFNGYVVPQGEVFSFNKQLGPVNAATGYLPELVILGDKTLPEYGGGLCQVSTTAYRGAWEYGLPIEARRNHSFAVRYYDPPGSDATIYDPIDMKFTNDTPGDLLIQTLVDGDHAYFIYYGTRDDRKSELAGPYTWGHVGIPAQRTEYTSEIAPGTTRKVGSPVPGLKAAWFRVVETADASEPAVEEYISHYQARPLYLQIGVAEGASQTAAGSVPEPDWFTTIPASTATTTRPSYSPRQPSRSFRNTSTRVNPRSARRSR